MGRRAWKAFYPWHQPPCDYRIVRMTAVVEGSFLLLGLLDFTRSAEDGTTDHRVT